MDPARLHRLCGATLLLSVVLGAAGAGVAMWELRWPDTDGVLDGQWAAAFEDALDEGVPFRDFAIASWGVVEFVAFGDGRPGVVVGTDDWLYSKEEFTLHPAESERRVERADLVGRVQAHLAARDVALLVALVPAKARVHPEHIGSLGLPAYTEDRYEGFRAGLVSRGVAAPDLFAPLRAAAASGPVFLRTDTHWTPGGAVVVAEALAEAARGLGVSGVPGSTTFETTLGEAEAHEGDLVRFVPLGPLQGSLGPAGETVAVPSTASKGGGGLGLLDDVTVPVTLVGTSYSAKETWNFDGALEQALGVEVLNVAQEGRGPFVPMLEYLANPAFTDSPPKLVIWEIPERFVPVDYALELGVLEG